VEQDATISGMRAISELVGADACTRLLRHSGRNNARRVATPPELCEHAILLHGNFSDRLRGSYTRIASL